MHAFAKSTVYMLLHCKAYLSQEILTNLAIVVPKLQARINYVLGSSVRTLLVFCNLTEKIFRKLKSFLIL